MNGTNTSITSASPQGDLQRHALQLCKSAFDRLAGGEDFNTVAEETGCTAAVTTALNGQPTERLGAIDLCGKLGIGLDTSNGNPDEAAFEAIRERFGEDWATGVAQGEIYDGLLDYAQLHLDDDYADSPGVRP